MRTIKNILLATTLMLGSMAFSGTLEQDFKQPPRAYKSRPLLHLNGTLTKEESTRQLKAARDASGFAGVALLPVRATKPSYLSDGYFEQYGHILDTCKSLDMTVVFYDDVSFPSGSAGKLMKQKFPNDIMCRLDRWQEEVTGPVRWEKALPDGLHMGAVAMNRKTLERIGIPASGTKVSWDVPAGSWDVMIFTGVRGAEGKNAEKVDYLSPESVEKFLTLTYDEYYKRFPAHFGSTIEMTFFDDVGMRYPEHRVWTPAFNEKFKAEYGYSPVPLYPALWDSIGPETEAARVALFSFRSKLLSDGFPRKVQEWAATHGVKSSGHAMGQYHPQPTFMAGDAMKFYEHSDIPMIDSIHYYGHGREGHKLTSSASYNYDKPLTSVEIYGNYQPYKGDPFNTDMLYRSGMELLALGANVFLPHGAWYNPYNVSIPPLISDFNQNIAGDLKAYNEWVGRCCLMLQGGRHVADIGVLYPIAAQYAYAELDAPVGRKDRKVHPGLFIPKECDMNELSAYLSGGARRDFTYLHPDVFNDRCSIEGDMLQLNNAVNVEKYNILILPGSKVIYWSNLQKVKAFYEAGGTVIATTLLPSKSGEFGHDNDVQQTIQEIFGIDPDRPSKQRIVKNTNAAGGVAYFSPEFKSDRDVLTEMLDLAQPKADVSFADVPPTIKEKQGMLLYLHKVKEDRNVYFFANSTDQTIDTNVRLRGKQKLQQWDPYTGTMKAIKGHVAGDYTIAPLKLEPLKSLFLVQER